MASDIKTITQTDTAAKPPSNFSSSYDGFINLGNNYGAINRLSFTGNANSQSQWDFDYGNENDFLGLNQFSGYKMFMDYSLLFSKSNSEIVFKSASKKNLEFEINHVQRLGEMLLFDINFLTARSLGFYSNQQTNFKKVNVGINAKSKNQRYEFGIRYFNYKFLNDENGGLNSDSIFANEVKSNTQLYTTNLTSSNSVYIDKNWQIDNEYFFLKRNFYHDSIASQPLTELSLKSKFKYNRQSFLFNSDAKENFFENNFIDTSKTKDTLWSKTYSHNLSVNFRLKKKADLFFDNLSASVYFENTAVKSGQYEFDSTFNVYNYGLLATYSILPRLNTGFKIDNGFIADNSRLKTGGGYLFAEYLLNKDFDFYFECSTEKQIPSLTENNFYSNHFIWQNSFVSSTVNAYALKISSSKYKTSVEAKLQNYSDYIFYDTDAQPKQYGDGINILKISASNKLRAGNFYFENAIVYRSSSDESVMRVPQFTTLSNWYYSSKVFKNNLEIQPGISLRYFSSFYGNAYQPATGQFYLQNEVKIGNYPYFDVFINMNLKGATILFMVEHVNAGLSGRNYFTAPHYPAAGRTIKFMIKWNLVN